MSDTLQNTDPDLNLFDSSNSCKCLTPNDFNVQFVNPTGLSMIHFNARSLQKHFNDITDFLFTLNRSFSIIAISETWIFDTPVLPFRIPGYNFVNSNRLSGRGGGVALFIVDSIKFNVRTDITQTEEESNTCESLFIDFVDNNVKFTVGVVYKKPSCNLEIFFEFYNKLLALISCQQRNIFILGDFNINLLVNSLEPDGRNFLNLNSLFGLFPLIKTPTRITMTSSTLIDNIFTNVLDAQFDCGCFSVDITDHLPVFVLTHIQLFSKRNIPLNVKRNICDEGINNLKHELHNLDWSPVYAAENVNAAYDLFIYMLIILLNKHLPFKESKIRASKIRKPWVTPTLLRYIRKKNKMYKRYLKNKTPLNERNYKTYRNKVNNLLRHAKKRYYSNQLNEARNDIKRTWSIINTILQKSSNNMPTYFVRNDTEIDDPQIIANEFNSYFHNCCTVSLESLPHKSTSLELHSYLVDNFPHIICFNSIN